MDVLMPQLGETVTSGTITTWFKKPGDKVKADDVLFEIETEKVSMEIPAQADGVLESILVEAGKTVDVGTKLAVISGSGAGSAPAASPPPAAPPPAAKPAQPVAQPAATPAPAVQKPARHGARSDSSERLSPVVRRLLAENNLDKSAISGTGTGGRITRNDVLAYLQSGKSARPAGPSPAIPARAPVAGTGGTQTIPFNNLRKRTAEHMVRSKATSPHVLQAVEADFNAVDQVRRRVSAAWKTKEGFSLTYLPFVARAVCLTITEFPHVNGTVENDALVVHGRINLAIAVDLNFKGLMAPVIKNADGLTVTGLARAIQDLSNRTRTNKLTPDEMGGGTYTISNSGTFGTLITAPIINQPQVAILSTDGVRKKPVVIEVDGTDTIAIRPVGILAQSFDHRAFDGAYSAAFLKRLREIIEQYDWAGELRGY